MDLDGLCVDVETFVLIDEEILYSIALVTLELDDVARLFVIHDGSIASELLLDDLQNLLQIKLGRNAFDCGQRLATITLLNAYMDVGLRGALDSLRGILILGIRKGIKRLEVLDLCGHTMLCSCTPAKCRNKCMSGA